MATDPGLGPTPSAIYRLLTWMSPAFPVGAYSYSHGLEHAVETGIVADCVQLTDWVDTVVAQGSGHNDGLFLAAAFRAVEGQDFDALLQVAELAGANRSTAELALESGAQGRAFRDAAAVAWPSPVLDRLWSRLAERECDLPHPIAVGVLAAAYEVPLETTLNAFLQAFAANLVSAGVRLIPLGQSDGVRACAALEATVLRTSRVCLGGDLEEIGTATPMIDWASASHETQYSRLFRS